MVSLPVQSAGLRHLWLHSPPLSFHLSEKQLGGTSRSKLWAQMTKHISNISQNLCFNPKQILGITCSFASRTFVLSRHWTLIGDADSWKEARIKITQCRIDSNWVIIKCNHLYSSYQFDDIFGLSVPLSDFFQNPSWQSSFTYKILGRLYIWTK